MRQHNLLANLFTRDSQFTTAVKHQSQEKATNPQLSNSLPDGSLSLPFFLFSLSAEQARNRSPGRQVYNHFHIPWSQAVGK